jgi:hypothetical protein
LGVHLCRAVGCANEPQLRPYRAALFKAVGVLHAEHERERRESGPIPSTCLNTDAFLGSALGRSPAAFGPIRRCAPSASRSAPGWECTRAGLSASGMCSAALLLCKLLAGHLGKRAPKDLSAPLTWFTSCLRLLTSACRQRIQTRWAWEPSPLCLSGYNSFGSRRARPARFLRRQSHPFCVCSSVDESQFAGIIGHQDLVGAPFEQTANPGRVGCCLDGYAHRRVL